MDQSPPIVSVIVPVYNAELYLAECLSSILNQSLSNFELICVDDGSTDRSVEILEAYATADRRMSVLRQNHCYAGAARNQGIQHARGKYLLFLDSDDFFENTLLENCTSYIEQFEADVCVFQADIYDNKSQTFQSSPWTCDPDLAICNQCFSRKTLPLNLYCFTTAAPWTKLFRREFVIAQGLQFQTTRSANDLFFVFTALSTAERIIILDKVLTHYRVNTGTSLQDTQHHAPLSFYHALTALRNELCNRGLFNELAPAYNNFALDCCIYNLGSLKKQKSFEFLYFYLRDVIFPELDLNCYPPNYFYAYPSNNICQKRDDINTLGVLEYTEKYNLFCKAPLAHTFINKQELLDIKQELQGTKQELQSAKQELLDTKQELQNVNQEFHDIKQSISFRIGRIITFIPRKMRTGLCYLCDNILG